MAYTEDKDIWSLDAGTLADTDRFAAQASAAAEAVRYSMSDLREGLVGGVVASLTISGGAVTLPAGITGALFTIYQLTIDTEGAASSDNLDSLTGGATGDICIMHQADNTRDVTWKDLTGNLQLSADFVATTIADTIVVVRVGSQWFELARSDNA